MDLFNVCMIQIDIDRNLIVFSYNKIYSSFESHLLLDLIYDWIIALQ